MAEGLAASSGRESEREKSTGDRVFYHALRADRGKPVAQNRIGVLVADSTRMGCQLLKDSLVRSRYRFEVFACAVSRAELLASLAGRVADVLILSEDLEDGPYTGFEALGELHSLYPKTCSVILLRAPNREQVVDAFRLGARGVFSRAASFELLCKCIDVVSKGQIWANSHELQFLLEALATVAPIRPISSNGHRLLGRREEEVARLVAEGMANREIAEKLHLSEHTVSNYLFRIYEKLGISSRVELVLYVLRQRQPAI